MTTWEQDLERYARRGGTAHAGHLRGQYLYALHQHTGRNVLAYYCGIRWDPHIATVIQQNPGLVPHLQSPHGQAALSKGLLGIPIPTIEGIKLSDVCQLRGAMAGFDLSLGVDLLIHTWGGHMQTALQIMSDLRSRFGPNIRAIVPARSASAGTFLACAATTIVMDRDASLGHIPSDPVFVKSASTYLSTGMFAAAGEREKTVGELRGRWPIPLVPMKPPYFRLRSVSTWG